jgi:CheY-like chemotaxis protein
VSTQLLVLAADSPEVIAGVQAQVVPLGYRLVITQPGPEILAIVARLGPAAVLIDWQPALRGMLRQLRSDGRTHTCPMVALVHPSQESPTELRSVDHAIPWPSDQLMPLLATPPIPVTPPPIRITVLYLRSSAITADDIEFDLPNLLHDCGCQVLEVDDLDQASLINRVWHPDVMVLDPAVADPDAYLQGLAEFPDLTQLALITLTPAATQAAHQFPKVMVYPCLVGECDWQVSAESNQVLGWLQEVLQVAIAQHPPF